ncbi:MAG TPA: GNAT family N-acetyltransferase [Acidobacteriaceae bacterium]|nr:GNAT family N-acetyltransferase [Acidobacteriaceae bacterium]
MSQAWEFELRECVAGDEERLALVGAASFLEAFAGFLQGEDILAHCRKQHSAEKYAAMLADPETRVVVAEVKGSAVGYAVVCPPDMPVAVTADDLELKRIYLLHRFQGSGIGAALMDWSVETARKLGKRRLLLGVNDENDKAVAFYLRHGFEHAGARRFQVGNMLCSDFILAKRLDG